MKAVAIKQFGGPDGLAIVDMAEPQAGAGQVVIDVEAIGVGGVDAVIRSGAVAAYGFKPGHILGGEVAGIVAAVGPGVPDIWVGRRVWGFSGLGGGYAERAVVSMSEVVPLPERLSTADAVTVGSSGVVAHFALRHAHFRPGETILIRGGAGGIGVMAVQIAAQQGATAIAVTTSSHERGEGLRALGATHILDRHGNGRQGDPEAYDVIVDIVAGQEMPAFFGRLAPNGRMVAVGIVGGAPPKEFGMQMFADFQRSLSFATFSANTVPLTDRRAVTTQLLNAAAEGKLQSVVHEILPLTEAIRAHHLLEQGVLGRLVLQP